MSPFYVISLLSMTAAFLSIILQGAEFASLLPSVAALNWLRVHFITIGTVTMFLFGSAPGLLTARTKGKKQSAAMTWAQFALMNIGYFMLLVGMPGNATWLASTGAWVIFAAVSLLFYSLYQIGLSAPGGDRAAVRFYVTAPFWLLIGITMAVSMLLNWPAPGGRTGILEAHVHANVWGFLAFTVAGTLLDMLPKIVKRPLAYPHLVSYTYAALLIGITGLVSGPWLASHLITLVGLVVYVVGTVLLLANYIKTVLGAGLVPASVGHLVLGYAWMVTPVFFAPFIVLAPEMVPSARVEAAAVQGLILGWVLQMAMGGIPTILRGVYPNLMRNPDPGEGRFGRGWPCVILVNLGVITLWVANLVTPGPYSMPGMGVGFGLIALGVLPFLIRLWMTFSQRYEVEA